MKWSNERPTTEGRHRWRANESSRIHVVRVRLRKGAAEYHCNTMNLRSVMTGGQWCPEVVDQQQPTGFVELV